MSDQDATIAADEGSSAQRLQRSWLSLRDGEGVDRYRVLGHLGGSMGSVHLAYDPQLGRKVVIKLLRNRAEMTAARRAELLMEARALAHLSHPNVIEILAVGEHEGTVYLAMEYVRGPTLERWLETDRPWPEIVDVFVAAGRGLQAAHENGLVHRDFKPSNVIVGETKRRRRSKTRRVRVIDFGLAIDLAQQSVSAPSDRGRRRWAGTPRYMAPEQFDCAEVDPRTDQFAFCVALFEALFRQHPFGDGSLPVLARRVTEGAIVQPDSTWGAPRAVRRAVLRGLSPSPADRWPTMAALLAVLDEARMAPRRARSRMLMAVAGVPVATTIWFLAGVDSPDRCDRAQRRAAAVWNEPRRDYLAHRFSQTDLSGAEAMWDATARHIDDHVKDWLAAYEVICDSQRSHAASDLGWDGQMRCLQDDLQHLDEILDAFESVDETAAVRAPGAVMALEPPVRCASHARLLESDELVSRLHGDLQVRMRQVSDEMALGRYDEAQEHVAKVIEEGRARGADPVVARALVLSGLLALQHNDPDRAMAELEQAYLTALSCGDDRAAAGAASKLVRHGAHRGIEHVDHWSRAAQSALKRRGDDTRLEAVIHYDRGTAALDLGDLDRAEKELVGAQSLFEQLEPPDPNAYAKVLAEMGLVYRARGQNDQAIANFEKALEIKKAALGSEHPDLVATMNNLAACYSSGGRLDKALAQFQEALAIAKRSWGQDSIRLLGPLTNYGLLLKRTGRTNEAQPVLERALTLIETNLGADHPHLTFPLQGLGDIAFDEGRLEAGLGYYHRLLDTLKVAHGLDRAELVHPLTTLGSTLTQLQRYAEARAHLEHALAIVQGPEKVEAEEHARVLLALGDLAWNEADLDLAQARAQGALEMLQHPEADPLLRAQAQLVLASALWTRGEKRRARLIVEQVRRATGDSGDASLQESLARWPPDPPVDASARNDAQLP